MYLNIIYLAPESLYRKYFKAQVFPVWVHGPLGKADPLHLAVDLSCGVDLSCEPSFLSWYTYSLLFGGPKRDQPNIPWGRSGASGSTAGAPLSSTRSG